jgi:hypothetical protein
MGTARPGTSQFALMKEPLMFSPKLRQLLGLAVVTTFALLVSSAGAGDEGFVSVFNGKDLSNFTYVLQVGTKKETVGDKTKNVPILEKGEDPLKASTGTFKIDNGVLVITGKPYGYIVTRKSYKNYIARFDWKYVRPADLKDDEKFLGNSGFLAHIQPGDTGSVWPKSIEIQGMNKEHGKIFPVMGLAKGKFSFDAEALKKARKPVGEWNTTEIIFKDGMITSKVNGVEISTGSSELTEGPWLLQSEGAEIHFKNIMVKETK